MERSAKPEILTERKGGGPFCGVGRAAMRFLGDGRRGKGRAYVQLAASSAFGENESLCAIGQYVSNSV
ncbi:hypothetical protein OKW41_008752 [Paraburkholderia sp. UCT70]